MLFETFLLQFTINSELWRTRKHRLFTFRQDCDGITWCGQRELCPELGCQGEEGETSAGKWREKLCPSTGNQLRTKRCVHKDEATHVSVQAPLDHNAVNFPQREFSILNAKSSYTSSPAHTHTHTHESYISSNNGHPQIRKTNPRRRICCSKVQNLHVFLEVLGRFEFEFLARRDQFRITSRSHCM